MVLRPKTYNLSCSLLHTDSQELKYADNVKNVSFTSSSCPEDDKDILVN